MKKNLLLATTALLSVLVMSSFAATGGVTRDEAGVALGRGFSGEHLVLRYNRKTIFDGHPKTDFKERAGYIHIDLQNNKKGVLVVISEGAREKKIVINWDNGYLILLEKSSSLITYTQREKPIAYD